MIIVKITSGLGNQMFQYAFSLKYLLEGKKVKYDLSYYIHNKPHNGFELTSIFKALKIEKASVRDIFYFVDTEIEKGEKVFTLKPNRKIIHEFPEQEFSFISDLESLDDIYFAGYWQHENYFKREAL